MTFSKKASVFVHSCSFRTFIHWKDMKIVLKQSDFSDPAILVQRNQQLKHRKGKEVSKVFVPAILVQNVVFQN